MLTGGGCEAGDVEDDDGVNADDSSLDLMFIFNFFDGLDGELLELMLTGVGKRESRLLSLVEGSSCTPFD